MQAERKFSNFSNRLIPITAAPSSGQNVVYFFIEVFFLESYAAFWPLDGADDTGMNPLF